MSPALQRIALQSEGPSVQELQFFNCYKIPRRLPPTVQNSAYTWDSRTEEENETETKISGNANYSRWIN